MGLVLMRWRRREGGREREREGRREGGKEGEGKGKLLTLAPAVLHPPLPPSLPPHDVSQRVHAFLLKGSHGRSQYLLDPTL